MANQFSSFPQKNGISYNILSITKKIAKRSQYRGIIINNHFQNRKQIRQQIETLAQYFCFIGLDELHHKQTHPGPKPFCLLTFDDGKKINYEETVPELEHLGIPAVFYIVTGVIDSDQPLWFDRLKNLQKQFKIVPKEAQSRTLKKLPLQEIQRRIDYLYTKYNLNSHPSDSKSLYMSWKDVESLFRKGFHIGAHTIDHPILTNESPTEAKNQIQKSISDIKKHTGITCTSFTFPNGNYTDELALYAQKCGAKTVMTTDPKWVHHQCPLWRLPRIFLAERVRQEKIALKISAALPGFFLKNPNGTGRKYIRKTSLKSFQAVRLLNK